MKKTTRVLVWLASLSLASVSAVGAQVTEPAKILVNANFGAQSHSHTVVSSSSFTVYAEEATVSSTKSVDGTSLFDFSIGYRVRDNLAVGFGVSRARDTASAEMVARIPHPFFFNRFQEVRTTVDDLDRVEVGLHIQAIWFPPLEEYLPENLKVALVVGPSFVKVRHALITSADVPAGTQNALPVTENANGTAAGFSGGFDVSYPVTPLIGIGGFVRYSGGSTDLTTETDVVVAEDVKAGGLQMGAGVRLGFNLR
jgi:hypothetical protein